MNAKRAETARKALLLTSSKKEVKRSPGGAVFELLVDLHHFCHVKGLNYCKLADLADRTFTTQYDAERQRNLDKGTSS